MDADKNKTLTDNELVGLIVSGDPARNFEVLYSRYYQKVFDKCISLVKNKELAEELTEDIFAKTFEKLPSFKHLSSFSSWLYSITYNHCIDYLREKRNIHYPKWNLDNQMPEIIDESTEGVEEITYENLLVILELIHPEEKALLLMKYKDNLSMKQIGEALRISEDAAKMRLKRARTRVIYLYNKKFF
jgi:RNA polymerase sigma factor (sigma-70 family)